MCVNFIIIVVIVSGKKKLEAVLLLYYPLYNIHILTRVSVFNLWSAAAVFEGKLNLIKCFAIKRHFRFAQKLFVLVQDYAQNNLKKKCWHPAAISHGIIT